MGSVLMVRTLINEISAAKHQETWFHLGLCGGLVGRSEADRFDGSKLNHL